MLYCRLMKSVRMTPSEYKDEQDRINAKLKRVVEQMPLAEPKYPVTKYHNEPTDGFDSKREHRRAKELWLLQAAGKIKNLALQPSFELIPRQMDGNKCVARAIVYKADFSYFRGGELIVEDSKGCRTEVYRLKRKLMLYMLGITITEV